MSDQLTHGGFSASGDLNDVQYRFVQAATTSPRVLQATGGSNPYPLGVLQNDPRSGEAANVCIGGVTWLYVDAAASAISYGALINCGSTGLGVPQGATSGSVAFAAQVVGDAVSTGSGVLTKVLLNHVGVKLAAS